MTHPQRYLFVDALRGVAALLVLLFHAQRGRHMDALYACLPAPLAFVFSHGYLGVQIFFVLSGFVIAHSMARVTVDFSYVARFLLRRSIRLDPPYWASIALALVFAMLSASVLPGRSFDAPDGVDILAHVLYLPVLLDRPLIRDVYWTLCLEIQFYLFFAMAMLVVSRLRRHWAEQRAFNIVLFSICVISLPWALREPARPVPKIFFECSHFFVSGVLAWTCVHFRTSRASRALAAVYFAGMVVLAFAFQDPARATAAITAGMIVLAGERRGLRTWLSGGAWQRLGAISYSLYLTHTTLAGPFFRAAYALSPRTAWREAGWLALYVGGCVAAAWLFHWAFERPSLQLSHRVSLRAIPRSQVR